MPKVKPLVYSPKAELEMFRTNTRVELAKRNWNVEDLALRSGIPAGTIYSWLRDPAKMRYGALCTIANTFGIDKRDLIGERKDI